MNACRTIAAGAIVAALLAGCGGDDSGGSALSADEYRSQLNTACDALGSAGQDAVDNDDLSSDEIQQAFDEANDEFNSTLAGLDPPDDLADAHQELVDLGDEAPEPDASVDEFRDYAQRNLDAFEAVGADTCVDLEQQGLDSINEAG